MTTTRLVKGPSKSKKKPAGRRYGPGRPTLEDLEQRKARILDVATALLTQRGYAETSLVDVAKGAGVATRTIYEHYGDKAAIFRAVVDKRVLAPEHDLPIIDADHDVFEILLTLANYICTVALEDSAIPFQRLMIAESQRFPDLMRQIFKSSFQRLHQNVISTFEKLEQSGKIPASDHTENTKFFIDLLLGSAPLQLTMNWITTGPSQKELKDKVSLFVAGRFGITAAKPSITKAAATSKASASGRR